MPEVSISIGGRDFTVACQDGEEQFLRAAASLLDAEATALSSQIGRLSESRLLLMAGLMIADKAAGMEEQLRGLETKLAEQEAKLENMPAASEPERIEVPVLPEGLADSLTTLAARAEALAERVEDKAAP